ncbi:MAG: prephenate dehydrogenase [Eubacterium sp.]|nr:prephenate dehydrogenase [Eubacterium sp.]
MVKSISIIGLGLIGGSLAKALRQKNRDLQINAVDSCTPSLRLAEKEGVINNGYTECCRTIYDSDIIFLCTPVRKAFEFISLLSDRIKQDCIITDVASTKGEICGYIDRLPKAPVFIGGHPMAGTEKSGYPNSLSHLFENAYYVLTPVKSTTDHAVSIIRQLLKDIGAIPIVVTPLQHDLVTGCISHVPHIIASALVSLAQNKESSDGLIKMLAAGGFKDITRIASSNPAMWENIVLSNSEIVVDLLMDYNKIINDFILNIKTSNNEEIYNFFEDAKIFRDGFSARAAGLIPPSFELLVDVRDEPGIIGKIATLLGNSNINIKNINVSNSREFEQGCLKITLSDQYHTDRAYEVLWAHSYRVFRNE